jgi:hypothetical protein
MSFLLERWRRGLTTAVPAAVVRCWVDDSTAEGHGETQGLAVWAEATRGFESLEQGDGAKVNFKKSGVICSRPRMQRLVELATGLRAQCPFGLVVGYGAAEPVGWEEHWRQVLAAPASTVFRWRSSGPKAELVASNAARRAAAAKAAPSAVEETAVAAEAAAGVVAAAVPAAALEEDHMAPCGDARLPQSAGPNGALRL